MTSPTLSAILEDARHRNEELSAAYRSVARRPLPRSVTGYAATAAEQRRRFQDGLGDLLVGIDSELLDSRPTLPPLPPAIPPQEAAARDDPAFLLAYFRDAEAADRDLFAAIAALPGLDPDLASRFHALSDEARKRASVAADHHDLLAL
jgi:hypothetical protein